MVLFFQEGEPTKNIRYYDFSPERSRGKTAPFNDDDLAEFVKLQKEQPETEQVYEVE